MQSYQDYNDKENTNFERYTSQEDYRQSLNHEYYVNQYPLLGKSDLWLTL